MRRKRKVFLVLIVLAFISLALQMASARVDHTDYEEVRECLECHPRAMPTHLRQTPSDMREDWPLDERGRMLCVTCHDCITGTCTLRKPSERLCNVCHDCTQGMSCLIGTVHMGDSPAVKAFSTKRCLTCHESAKTPDVCMLGEHKADVVYLESANPTLRGRLEQGILIMDGKVTCFSCHNPYSTRNAKLTRSNRESRFCLRCHHRLARPDHAGIERVETCLACHPRTLPTHRQQVPGKMKGDWPLDEQGRMLCVTCHDCITGTCNLRKPSGELCTVCHDCTQGMSCVIGTVHWGNAPDEQRFEPEKCLSCHDNVIGPGACPPGEGQPRTDTRLKCVSCHDPYSRGHQKLRPLRRDAPYCPRYMEPYRELREGAFCLRCHRK
jgi:predicted CXXCH cytochrome family protein